MDADTRHQFHEALRELEQQTMGGLAMVTEQLQRALDSLRYGDVPLAESVLAGDDEIDRRYLEVHQAVLTLLATQQPMAGDLRLVAALLHIVRCVERMGDQCVDIVKLVPLAGPAAPEDEVMLAAIERMGRLAGAEVAQAKETFRLRDLELARDLVRRDDEVDDLNREVFRRAVEIGADSALREWAMFMVLVARALERIGDNAVDIAEQTVFLVSGQFRQLADDSHPDLDGRGSPQA
jgi:phosphate transport system protein